MHRGQEYGKSEVVGKLMTDAAVILRWNVIDRLWRGDPGAVAGSAAVGIDTGVVVGDPCKGRVLIDIVAVGAVQRRRYMIT